MNNKYIVPIVAIVLCAVSLIGAGYAAYTATLTDTESVNVDNNYVTLTPGSSMRMETEIDVYWDQVATTTGGANLVTNHYPYLDLETTTGVKQALLGVFSIDIESTNSGDEVKDNVTSNASITTYTLAVSSLTQTGITLTDAALKVYTTVSAGVYSGEATLTELAGETSYYVVLEYNQTGSKDGVTTNPPATATLSYTLTATANIANA